MILASTALQVRSQESTVAPYALPGQEPAQDSVAQPFGDEQLSAFWHEYQEETGVAPGSFLPLP